MSAAGTSLEREWPVTFWVKKVSRIMEVRQHGWCWFIPIGAFEQPRAKHRSLQIVPAVDFLQVAFSSKLLVSPPMFSVSASLSISEIGRGFPLGMFPYCLCRRWREIVSRIFTSRGVTSPKTSGISHVYTDVGACRTLQSFWPSLCRKINSYFLGQLPVMSWSDTWPPGSTRSPMASRIGTGLKSWRTELQSSLPNSDELGVSILDSPFLALQPCVGSGHLNGGQPRRVPAKTIRADAVEPHSRQHPEHGGRPRTRSRGSHAVSA